VRILVAGNKGQLATDLKEAAVRQGMDLVAFGRPELDLTDRLAAERCIQRVRPSIVINAGAYTAVDKAESEPDLAFAVNTDGPARLAAACARAGIPLIHISTDQVFGDNRAVPHREIDAPAPLCVYGRSKLEGEQAVAAAQADHVIARVSWVFGPTGDNFVKKVLSWAETSFDTGRPLRIVADQWGKPTYSPDLAEALLNIAICRLATSEAATTRGLFHLAGSTALTRADQAQLILDAARARGFPAIKVTPVTSEQFPTPARRPSNGMLDTSKAYETFGIQLGSFEDALERTLERLIGPRGGQFRAVRAAG